MIFFENITYKNKILILWKTKITVSSLFFHSLNEDTKIYLFDYEDVDKFENEKDNFARKLNASGYSWKITKKFISSLSKLEIEEKLLSYLNLYNDGKYKTISEIPSDLHDKFLMSFLKTILKSYIVVDNTADCYCIHENLEDVQKYGNIQAINTEISKIFDPLKKIVNFNFVEKACNCEYTTILPEKIEIDKCDNPAQLFGYNDLLKHIGSKINEKMMCLGEQHCAEIIANNIYNNTLTKNNKKYLTNYNISFCEDVEGYTTVNTISEAHIVLSEAYNRCLEELDSTTKWKGIIMCNSKIFNILKLADIANKLNISSIQELPSNDDRILFSFNSIDNDDLLEVNVCKYYSLLNSPVNAFFRSTYEINENNNSTKNNYLSFHVNINNDAMINIIQQTLPILPIKCYNFEKLPTSIELPSKKDVDIKEIDKITFQDNKDFNKVYEDAGNRLSFNIIDKLFNYGWSHTYNKEKYFSEILNISLNGVKQTTPKYEILSDKKIEKSLNITKVTSDNSQIYIIHEQIKECINILNEYHNNLNEKPDKFIVTNISIARILLDDFNLCDNLNERIFKAGSINLLFDYNTISIPVYVNPAMRADDTRLLIGNSYNIFNVRPTTPWLVLNKFDNTSLEYWFNNIGIPYYDYLTIYIDILDNTANEKLTNAEYAKSNSNTKQDGKKTYQKYKENYEKGGIPISGDDIFCSYNDINDPIPGISCKLNDDINKKWTKFLPEVYKYTYNAIPSNVQNTIDSAAKFVEITDEEHAILFFSKCGYSIYRGEGVETRYFQHIDPSDENLFLTITKLKDIKTENSENIYYFEDGTYYNEVIVGKVNEVTAFMHKPIAEISDETNFWKIKKYELETKTVKDTQGREYTAKEYFTEHTPDITYIYNIPKVVPIKIENNEIFSENIKNTDEKNKDNNISKENISENISAKEENNIQEITKSDNDNNLAEQINDIKNILKALKVALGKLNI